VVLPLPGLFPSAALANVVVKEGDTLSEIADRNGISLKRLMQANGLTDPSKLAVGQTLVIPGGGRSSSPGPSRASSGAGSITVKDGDTLSEIADRNGVSLKRLMQANGLTDPGKLAVGETLVIPGARGYSNQAAAPKSVGTAPYTVKKGETISELAERFGTTTNRLLQLNNISDPKLVIAGTRISVPGRASTASAAAGRTSGAYVVQSGETLSHIADRYNTSVDRLVAINKLADPNMVAEGSLIKLQAPPAPKPAPKQATKPKPKPKPAVQTAAKPKPPATVQTAAKPVVETKPVAETNPAVVDQTALTVAKATATTSPTTESKPAAKPAETITSRSTTNRTTPNVAGSDWRNYGPIQVDWANWKTMGGSYVAPTLNSKGRPLYLAINCSARKLNTTSQAGQWKSWEPPQVEFEEQLVSDLCKAKGG
jgi:LysM repeat protein